ncbi:MAG: glycerol-3-phosphate acyltransferase, partial [Rhodobacteraceae bacterium]|nr:glycerol-3-phosphate acyltransferase [Paracoccaceae bacterium]
MPGIETGGVGLILAAVLGYLLGSVPFGVLVTKA